MSRVIVLAGVGGAGTSTLAGATARDARSAGASVRLVDVADPALAPSPELRELLSRTIGSMAMLAGADRVAPEAWMSLPGARLIAALDVIRRTSLESDLVVVDAGGLLGLRELLDLPHVLLRMLDASLTPRAAMTRAEPGSSALFDALSEARLQVLHLGAVLTSNQTSVRLVGRPTADAVASIVAAAGMASLLGVQVDGVILPRFPRKKDGAAGRVRREARAARGELKESLPDVTVWSSARRSRPVPPGAAVTDLLPSQPPVAAAGEPVARGEAFEWDVLMPQRLRDEARVGVQEGSLVLECRGTYRWLELPPVLTRCVPVEGLRTDEGLSLTWVPDVKVWPRSAEAGDDDHV